jgi:hypothetical protein
METKVDLISIIDLIGLIANIASLILSILAIWLALYFKKESDKVNQNTASILLDIKSDAKTLSQVAMPELQAYGQFSRQIIGHQVIGQVSTMEIDNLAVTPASAAAQATPGKTQIQKQV